MFDSKLLRPPAKLRPVPLESWSGWGHMVCFSEGNFSPSLLHMPSHGAGWGGRRMTDLRTPYWLGRCRMPLLVRCPCFSRALVYGMSPLFTLVRSLYRTDSPNFFTGLPILPSWGSPWPFRESNTEPALHAVILLGIPLILEFFLKGDSFPFPHIHFHVV